jgi:hypothetical protein
MRPVVFNVKSLTILAVVAVVLLVGHQSLADSPEVAVLRKVPNIAFLVNIGSSSEHGIPGIPVVLMIGSSGENFEIFGFYAIPMRSEVGEVARDVDTTRIRKQQVHTRH